MSGGVSTITQTIAAAQDACVVQCDAHSAVAFAIAAGLTGTVVVEGSVDGSTFFNMPAWGTVAGAQSSGFANPAAQVIFALGGPALKAIRLRCSAFTSGSAAVIGQVDDTGVAAYTPVNVLNTVNVAIAQPFTLSASTSGAATRYRYKSVAASDNLVSVKASAGNIHHLIVSNANAAIRFLKLYDKASAPILASDTPQATIVIPAGGTVVAPYDLIRYPFALGIAHAIVTAAADATSGNTGADEVFLTMLYA